MYDDFVLNFNFSTQLLAINDFIAADREVRRRIEAAEVLNYPWQPTLRIEKRSTP